MRPRDQRSGQVISQLPKLSKRGMDFVGGDSPVANQVVSFFFFLLLVAVSYSWQYAYSR